MTPASNSPLRRIVRVMRMTQECGHDDVISALEQLKKLQEYVRSSASNGCAEARRLMAKEVHP